MMPEAPKKESKFLKKEVAIIAIVLVLCIFFYGKFRYSLHAKVAAQLEILKQENVPLTLEDLDALYKVPGKNAADVYQQAFALYPKKLYVKELPLIGDIELPSPQKPLSNNLRNKINNYLQKQKQTLTLLNRASAISQCRYPADLTEGFRALLPHLSNVQHGVKLLSLQAILAMEEKNYPQAVKSIVAAFNVSYSLKNEPILISQLVKIACQLITISTCERLINKASLTKEQLDLLQKTIKQENSNVLEKAILGEMANAINVFENFHGGTLKELNALGMITYSSLVYRWAGYLDRDYIYYLESMMQMLRAVRKKSFFEQLQVAQEMKKNQAKIFEEKKHLISSMLFPAYENILQKTIYSVEMAQATKIALAIEKHRLDNNKLPQKLGQLVPGYLKKLPLNPYDQKAFRYKQQQQSYTVYSFGENGKDDGGKSKDEVKRPDQNWDATFIVKRK